MNRSFGSRYDEEKNNKNPHVSMCWTFSPYKLKGIYFPWVQAPR